MVPNDTAKKFSTNKTFHIKFDRLLNLTEMRPVDVSTKTVKLFY